jgi:hypothetical protein
MFAQSCAYCRHKSDRTCGDCQLRLCPTHGATHYGTATALDECPSTPLEGPAMHHPQIITAHGRSRVQCDCGYESTIAYHEVAFAQMDAQRHALDVLDGRAAVRAAEILISEHQQRRA